jgi:hypothetical protein
VAEGHGSLGNWVLILRGIVQINHVIVGVIRHKLQCLGNGNGLTSVHRRMASSHGPHVCLNAKVELAGDFVGKAKWSLMANLIARQTSVKEISDKVTPQTILPVLKDKFPKTAGRNKKHTKPKTTTSAKQVQHKAAHCHTQTSLPNDLFLP